MPPESETSEPEAPSLDLAIKDKLKALELVYSFALTYSSSFNTVGAAVIFGLFSLLLLVSASSFLSAAWFLLSAACLLTVLTGVYFYLRAVRYTMMASEAAKRLGIIGLAEDVYRRPLEQLASLSGQWRGDSKRTGSSQLPISLSGQCC